jgi:hypothetical protein
MLVREGWRAEQTPKRKILGLSHRRSACRVGSGSSVTLPLDDTLTAAREDAR